MAIATPKNRMSNSSEMNSIYRTYKCTFHAEQMCVQQIIPLVPEEEHYIFTSPSTVSFSRGAKLFAVSVNNSLYRVVHSTLLLRKCPSVYKLCFHYEIYIRYAYIFPKKMYAKTPLMIQRYRDNHGDAA